MLLSVKHYSYSNSELKRNLHILSVGFVLFALSYRNVTFKSDLFASYFDFHLYLFENEKVAEINEMKWNKN